MKRDDPVLHEPSEALRGQNLHYSGAGNTISSDSSDRKEQGNKKGSEDSVNQIKQKEKEIDPGNEHTHGKNAEESFEKQSGRKDDQSEGPKEVEEG